MGNDASEDSVPELREWQRKQNALDRALEGLEDDYPENKNSILASNQVASELGVFSDESAKYLAERDGRSLDFGNIPGREWSAPRERLIQVQTRLSALQAQLNTGSILAELRKTSMTLEQRLKKLELLLAVVMGLLVAVVVKLIWN
jgi:hypothetical protein